MDLFCAGRAPFDHGACSPRPHTAVALRYPRGVKGGFTSGEFDDEERPGSGPLLPPEDRLWRHPSEISAPGDGERADAVGVRDRWLAREPSRSTAWSAGLVGALLATGIVLVGSHLAGVLTSSPTVEQTAAHSLLPVSAPATTVPGGVARGYGLGRAIDAAMLRVGTTTVSVNIFRGSTEERMLGLVLPADGTVVTAAGALLGATSILVEPPKGGVDLVATVLASDSRSGLALLSVRGLPQMPSTAPVMATKIAPDSLALALTSAGGVTYAPATITATDAAAKVDGASLVDATETDLSSSYAPPGSPVLDDTGALIGIVVGTANGRVVLCPSWLIRPVTDELEHLGRVTQGWMGINGTTVRATGTGGVRVLAVTPGSAASRAGIAVGDIITAVDAEPVPSITALQGRLYADRPGSTVAVVVLRKGAAVALRLTLGGAHG